MKKSVHGGDIYGATDPSRPRIDYSANINPMGLPEGVKAAIRDSLDLCVQYPDPLCRELAAAVAQSEGVSASHLVFGNGAADVIFRLVLAKMPKRALLPAPTFSEYEMALRVVRCDCRFHELREETGFRVGEALLEALGEDLDILFLCNPNNPTGAIIPRGLLVQLLERCRELDVLMVVDECFLSMTCEASLKEYVAEYSNLFLLKAFTKDYAMPGIRLGYGMCSDEALLEAIFQAGQPWSVSLLAQKAGVQALRETEYLEASRRLIAGERARLQKALDGLGYTVYPPTANYIFFRVDRGRETFHQDMEQAGFLIRDCGNYRGLGAGSGYFRIAVKAPEDNGKLIRALEEREEKWREK